MEEFVKLVAAPYFLCTPALDAYFLKQCVIALLSYEVIFEWVQISVCPGYTS